MRTSDVIIVGIGLTVAFGLYLISRKSSVGSNLTVNVLPKGGEI